MAYLLRTGLALVLVATLSGCCMWKQMTGSEAMIDEPPTVDINRYKTLAVVSVRPFPGDPALTEVEARLVKFGTPHGLTIIKGDQLGRLQQMMEDRLNAIRSQANFQQQMAQQQRAEQQAIHDEASKNQMVLADDAVERQAAMQAYVGASNNISGQYENEVKRIFQEAMANSSQFGIPKIDGLIMVDVKEFGRPSILDIDASGIPVGGGHTIAVKYKQVTLNGRVGWSLVDPNNGQIIQSDVYPLEVSATAEIGGAYDGAGGSISFDLGHLQQELWGQLGFKIAENFYPHQRPECEEKSGVQR